jgi:hypothetical protein
VAGIDEIYTFINKKDYPQYGRLLIDAVKSASIFLCGCRDFETEKKFGQKMDTENISQFK